MSVFDFFSFHYNVINPRRLVTNFFPPVAAENIHFVSARWLRGNKPELDLEPPTTSIWRQACVRIRGLVQLSQLDCDVRNRRRTESSLVLNQVGSSDRPFCLTTASQSRLMPDPQQWMIYPLCRPTLQHFNTFDQCSTLHFSLAAWFQFRERLKLIYSWLNVQTSVFQLYIISSQERTLF